MNASYKQLWEENPLQMVKIPLDRIIVIPELSGRSEFKRDPEKIKATAASIKAEGQIEPAVVGLNTDPELGEIDAPVLYVGFGRYEACKLIDEDLLCSYSPIDVKDRGKVLTRGMHENLKRDDLSAIQVAMNIRRLREDEGLKDAEIAKRLGVSPGYISNFARFISYEKDAEGKDTETPMYSKFALMAIHKKQIPQRAAVDLWDLGSQAAIDEAVKELIEAEKAGGGKVSTTAVREVVRKKAKKKKNKKGKEVATTKARTVKEIKALFELLGGEGEPRRVKGFASLMLGFIAGEEDTESVAKRVSKLVEPPVKTAKAA